jgi:hypothetical protein
MDRTPIAGVFEPALRIIDLGAIEEEESNPRNRVRSFFRLARAVAATVGEYRPIAF